MRSIKALPGLLLVLGTAIAVRAEEAEPPAKAIQDNSFLIEEAYNQEAGVVQHIFNAYHSVYQRAGPDDKAWNLAFTQEWPVFSQTHQLSYTVPYSFVESGGQSVDGLGDVMLNYRLQALYEGERQPAFAPRFSLILPTGDEAKGLGNDTLGYQFNLPLSKVVSDRVTLHANTGVTFFPDLNDRTPLDVHLGGSAIYAATRHLNLMLELLGVWTETVDAAHQIDHDFEAVISPGFRYGFDLGSSQLVLGFATPIGLTEATPEYGLFFYLSFEHRFLRE